MPSPGQLAELESQQNEEQAPPQDQDALNFYIGKINTARDQRQQPRREFDDMTYEQDYAMNQLTGNSYLRRKRNDDEVRINTGTAEKKVELIYNELLAMNFQPDITAFDEDDLLVQDLGGAMTNVVQRTNEIERDEDVYVEAFHELLTQRAVFIEEYYGPLPVAAVRTGRSGRFKDDKHCQKRVLSGLQVFLGDITIPAYKFHEQPCVIKYDRMLYEEAEAIYGDMEFWKYVKPGMPMNDSYGLWFKYRLGDLAAREVEIITYMSTGPKKGGEYQVIINGVMMYEPGEKLPWKHGGYNMTMVIVKPMSRFLAYGKQPIASAKALQGLADETIRNLVRKMRQAIEPPLGVASGKVYSKDIWSPASVTQGLPQGAFTRLIDHDGVTPSEMGMFNLINQEINNFIGQQGVTPPPGTGTPTATQIIEQQKQSLKMLGLSVLAAMRLKREMTWLRLWDIMEHYFEPVGTTSVDGEKVSSKYRSFTVEDVELGDGATGKQIIQFADKVMEEGELDDLENLEGVSEENGEPFRLIRMNVKDLKAIPLTWYVVVSSHEREGGALDKIMFQDQTAQAYNLSKMTGRQLKADKVIDTFEQVWKARGWFERSAPAETMDMASLLGGAPAGPQQPGGAPPGPSAQQMQPSPQGRQMTARQAVQPGMQDLTKMQ